MKTLILLLTLSLLKTAHNEQITKPCTKFIVKDKSRMEDGFVYQVICIPLFDRGTIYSTKEYSVGDTIKINK